MKMYLFSHFELVAYAPDGLQAPLVRHTLQFLTKTFDVDVNRTGITEIIKTPDLIQKLVSCKLPFRSRSRD